MKTLTEEEYLLTCVPGGTMLLGTKKGDRVGLALEKLVERDDTRSNDWKEKLESLTREFEKLSAADRVKAWSTAMRCGTFHIKACKAVHTALHKMVLECFNVSNQQDSAEK